MFEVERRRSPLIPILAGVVVAASAGAWWIGTDGFDLLGHGVSPFASPVAAASTDAPYAGSPLTTWLELDAQLLGEAKAAKAEERATELAREVGVWMLRETSESTVEDAEIALWEQGRIDALALQMALTAQRHSVYARKAKRMAEDPTSTPWYVHPDELPILFAHIGQQLDLHYELILSPKHFYLHLKEPGGERVRAVEPTCLWRVDATGAVVPSDELSVGRRLVFPTNHYPSGVGGLRNPPTLSPGVYEPIGPEALTGRLAAALAARSDRDPAGLLEEMLAEGKPVAGSLAAVWLQQAFVAVEQQDGSRALALGTKLTELRTSHGDQLSDAPDEAAVLAAAHQLRGSRSQAQDALAPLFAHYGSKPVEQPASEAHALGMWADLRTRKVTHNDWNARIIPLMNKHRSDAGAFSELCRYGTLALSNTEQSLQELMPDCP